MKQIRWFFMAAVFLAQATGATVGSLSMKLEKEWRFIKGDPPGAQEAARDTSNWDKVSVPHTWNASDWQKSDYYRGPAWYRRTCEVPATWKGKRVFVRFEAVGLVAEMWVNGTRVGAHRGAFAAFCFEITPQVRFGAANELAVRVNNAKVDDVPPLSGDFNIFGGIYRPVTLFAREPVCITPLDYASPGVAAKVTAVNDERAEIGIATQVSNGSSAAQPVEIHARIQDASGKAVVEGRQQSSIPAGQTRGISQALTVLKPHLWNGIRDPYLYSLTVELRSGERVLDAVMQPLGLRSVRFDPAQGCILNGKPYPIRGVNRHQDREGFGWAISEQQQYEDISLVREIGANGIRLAHYQHSDYFYTLCDRAGLLVWAEIPLVNEVNPIDAFQESARQQLTELIRQNINHPSIIVWSVYNEIGLRTKADPTALVKNLNALAKSEDSTRPTVGATSQGELSKYVDMVSTPDLRAGNLYPGWYSGDPADMGKLLDQFNQSYGSRGFGVSEYGAGASIRQHEQGMTKRPDPRGKWHPEEWQAIVHEQNYAAIAARPFVWASFVWNMFDFASAGRTEGDREGVNDKGLVTADRKTRKDAFFFYKANWTQNPMVYITSRRHTERTQELTDVKVYSNLPQVGLKVNGKSYGPATANDVHVFLWSGIRLAPGNNRIEVEARQGGKMVGDSCTWQYKPASK
jgi:beta-galactosidase